MKKIIIFLTIIAIVLIMIYLFKPYYKVSDRIKSISDYKSNNVSSLPLGWLKVQGTNIDFPIFYYYDIEDITNPEYELGWSFEDKRKLKNRTVILSHNVLNVSSKPLIDEETHKRFEQLMAYVYYDFVKQNKYIQYTIDGKNNLFKIYGISFQKEENILLDGNDDLNIKEYIKTTKENSYFDFDVKVDKNDELITLVTCTRFFGNSEYSFVIDARKVRKNELIKNYSVTEKKNYNKIKRKLEGDDSDE